MAGRGLTVDEIMAILPATPRRIAGATENLEPAQLHASPGPDAWSINDILAHLRACHDVLGGNILRILAEDSPTWRAMNPRTWMTKTDYPDWTFATAFEAFRTQRAALLAVVEPLPPEGWERTARVTGLVGGVGLRSALYYGDWMAGHERSHVRLIGRLVVALGAPGETSGSSLGR